MWADRQAVEERLHALIADFLDSRGADSDVDLDLGVVALVAEVKSALQACAAWHKTPQVVVRYATEPGLAKRLSD